MADFSFLLHSILDCVFPIECLRCGAYGDYCCANCLAHISVKTKSYTINQTTVFSAFAYADSTVRTLIHDYKYHNLTSAHPSIEKLIYRWALMSGHLISENCVLVPVPLHTSKMRSRGFNQSEHIAKILGEALDLPVMTDLLYRVSNDVSQTESVEREKNVSGAFRAREGFQGEIFLVDDVITSGATLRACIGALSSAGVPCTGGFAFAWGNHSQKNSSKKAKQKPGF